MNWLWIVLAAWLVLSVAAALLLSRVIRTADRREYTDRGVRVLNCLRAIHGTAPLSARTRSGRPG